MIPGMTPLKLDVLMNEGLIFCDIGSRTRVMNYGSRQEQSVHEESRTCYVTPAGFRAVDSDFAPIIDTTVRQAPVEITESLNRLRADFPDNTRLAFIMMRFGSTSAHQRIHASVRAALEPHGFTGLRRDDKEYHSDLYYNILTYMHAVRFGIAVIERLEEDAFNPNVSLEVGYMLALGKSVCLLKDSTVRTLQADLIGKLYREFDPQDPRKTIPPQVLAWMDDKGFIVRR